MKEVHDTEACEIADEDQQDHKKHVKVWNIGPPLWKSSLPTSTFIEIRDQRKLQIPLKPTEMCFYVLFYYGKHTYCVLLFLINNIIYLPICHSRNT